MSVKQKQRIQKSSSHYLLMFVGSCLSAFAITAILRPNQLITGGITGISILLDGTFGLPYTIFYYLLAMLVMLATFLTLGKKEVKKIIVYSILFPMILILFETLNLQLILNDLFLSAVFYGIIGGGGFGLIIISGFSSGGTDTIAKILHHRLFPFVSISKLLLFIDIAIILASAFKYNINTALYAIVTQVVFVKSMESIIYGFSSKKVKLEIISENYNDIEDFILNTVVRGITKYRITGGYTKKEKTVLTTICTPRESILIKNFISSVDQDAFIDVLPVSSVWGKGVGFEPLIDNQ